jgi:hypothetical protein
MAVQTLKGPWRGMDLREGEAAENTYAIGANIDTSDGQLAARPPLGARVLGIPYGARLHLIDRPGSRMILAVGRTAQGLTGGTVPAILAYAIDPDTMTASSATDLTASYGEPPDDGAFTCSFLDAWIKPTASGVPRPVTIITTRGGSYVYDPSLSLSAFRPVSASDDGQARNSANFGYSTQPIRAPIAVEHRSRVFYMGFSGGERVVLSDPLASDQSDVPEAHVEAGRASLVMAPNVILATDPNDPAVVCAPLFWTVDPRERVTGAYSTGEVLLIFTDKAIWAFSGDGLDSFALHCVVTNTGCSSHTSIVGVGGVVYFAGFDGLYAFGGLGAPEATKITGAIERLWNPRFIMAEYLPEAFGPLQEAGWPWTVDRRDLVRIVGRFYATPRQIWWSLPILTSQWKRCAMPVTLVYDVETAGFNVFYCASVTAQGAGYGGPMSDAVDLDGRWLTSNTWGQLTEYGYGEHDGDPAANNGECSVPAYWLSRRFPEAGDDEILMTGIRYRLLGSGVVTTAQDPVTDTVGADSIAADLPMWTLDGEPAAHDAYDESGTAQGTDDRFTRTGELTTYQWGADSPSLMGAFVLGESTLQAPDWWTSRADVHMKSRWFRIGFRDDGLTYRRAPVVRVASVGVEMASTGTTRR